MKRIVIAALIIGLIVTVLNFAGFFSPGFNPDGYRGSVVRITWLAGDDLPYTLAVGGDRGWTGQVNRQRVNEGWTDLSIAVDDRWTSIRAKFVEAEVRYLVRNERILEIQVE